MSRSELLQLGRSQYGINENCWLSNAQSGVIAAGAAALSIFWAQRLPNSARGKNPMIVERLRLTYTCLTAFTTPVTASRALAFCVLDSQPSFSGVSNYRSLFRKQGLLDVLGVDGTVACCNTTPFTPGGAAPSIGNVFATLDLTGFGSSGSTVTREWTWTTGSAAMVGLAPDTTIGLIATAAMDAAGTFQITVETDIQSLPTGYPDPPP